MLKEPSDSQIEKFLAWIIEKALNGFPPLSSATHLATEYLIDTSYHDHDDRVGSLINWETSKNFTSGFITGLGGLLTLPIAIPTAFGASWIIQARMSAAIALIHGHSLESDRVRTLILLSLLGDGGKEVFKQAGIQVARKVTENLLKQIPGKVLIEINKKVGFRLITKAGERGVINLVKGVPVLGGLVGGAFDAASCRAVGSAAHNIFRRETQPLSGTSHTS